MINVGSIDFGRKKEGVIAGRQTDPISCIHCAARLRRGASRKTGASAA